MSQFAATTMRIAALELEVLALSSHIHNEISRHDFSLLKQVIACCTSDSAQSDLRLEAEFTSFDIPVELKHQNFSGRNSNTQCIDQFDVTGKLTGVKSCKSRVHPRHLHKHEDCWLSLNNTIHTRRENNLFNDTGSVLQKRKETFVSSHSDLCQILLIALFLPPVLKVCHPHCTGNGSYRAYSLNPSRQLRGVRRPKGIQRRVSGMQNEHADESRQSRHQYTAPVHFKRDLHTHLIFEMRRSKA